MALSTKTANGIKYPVGSDTLDIGHFKEMAESIDEKIGAPKGLETKYASFADIPVGEPGMYIVDSSATDAPFNTQQLDADWIALQTSGMSFTVYAFCGLGYDSSIYFRASGYSEWKRCLDTMCIIDNLTSGGTGMVLSAEQGKVLKGLIDNIEGIQDLGTVNGDGDTPPVQDVSLKGTYYFKNQQSQYGILFAPGIDQNAQTGYQFCLYGDKLWVGLVNKTSNNVTWSPYGVSASAVLTKTNTTAYTPTTDYHPSTKKYVDDAIKGITSGSSAFQEHVLTKDPLTNAGELGQLQNEGAYLLPPVAGGAAEGYLFVYTKNNDDTKCYQTLIMKGNLYTREFTKGSFNNEAFEQTTWDKGKVIQEITSVISPLEDQARFWQSPKGIYRFLIDNDTHHFGYLFVAVNNGLTSQTMFLNNKIYVRQGNPQDIVGVEWSEISQAKTPKVYGLIIGSAAGGDTADTCDILVGESDDIVDILNSDKVPANSHIFLKKGQYTVRKDGTINKPMTITGEGSSSTQFYGSSTSFVLEFGKQIIVENCSFYLELSIPPKGSQMRKCNLIQQMKCPSKENPTDTPATIIKDNYFKGNSQLSIIGTDNSIENQSIIIDNNCFATGFEDALTLNGDVRDLRITNNEFYYSPKVRLSGGAVFPSSYAYIANNRGIGDLTIGKTAKSLKITNNIIGGLKLSQSTDPAISYGVEISDNDFTSNISTSEQTLGFYSKFTGNRINYHGDSAWEMMNFQTGGRTGAAVGNNMINGKMDKLVFLNGEEMGRVLQTYGVSIDLSNSNPETAVTYTDDAIGMTPGSSDWYNTPIFSKIRPCLFKEGKVVGYLNPNNFAKFEDGTDADITSGAAGDVMIEIPKIGYKISKNGTTLNVQITEDPNKKSEGFCYYAHTRDSEGDRDNLYIGAFLGSLVDDKLRSLSGQTPLHNSTISAFRTFATANGARYDQLAFYPLTLLQCLYLIQYKNLNSQAALGYGYVGMTAPTNTGATIAKGMNYGLPTQQLQMKFLGIEDFWGNLMQWVDGLRTGGTYILTSFKDFNDTGSGYTERAQVSENKLFGFMGEPQGDNESAFVIEKTGGSTTTYFSDYAAFENTASDVGGLINSSSFFGGSFKNGESAGAFQLCMSAGPGANDEGIGGRLMYL